MQKHDPPITFVACMQVDFKLFLLGGNHYEPWPECTLRVILLFSFRPVSVLSWKQIIWILIKTLIMGQSGLDP